MPPWSKALWKVSSQNRTRSATSNITRHRDGKALMPLQPPMPATSIFTQIRPGQDAHRQRVPSPVWNCASSRFFYLHSERERGSPTRTKLPFFVLHSEPAKRERKPYPHE